MSSIRDAIERARDNRIAPRDRNGLRHHAREAGDYEEAGPDYHAPDAKEYERMARRPIGRVRVELRAKAGDKAARRALTTLDNTD